MKHRLDFVTNSSSSSFIMTFRSKDSVETEMVENTKTQWGEDAVDIIAKALYVANDIKNNGNPESKEEILTRTCNDYRDSIVSDAVFDRYWNARHNGIISEAKNYSDYYEEATKDPRFMKVINAKVDLLRAELEEKMKDNNFFIEMTYADEDGNFFSQLEHEIMPYHPNTIHVISHH